MGHYETQREAHYDEMRGASARRRCEVIPKVLESLAEAHRLLALHKSDIRHSGRITSDLDMYRDLLRAQLP